MAGTNVSDPFRTPVPPLHGLLDSATSLSLFRQRWLGPVVRPLPPLELGSANSPSSCTVVPSLSQVFKDSSNAPGSLSMAQVPVSAPRQIDKNKQWHEH